MRLHPVPLLAAALLLGGCATSPRATSPEDPWESYNRSVYRFNDAVDRAVLRPTAEAYEAYVPKPVSRSVSNFFGNLGDVLVFVNDLLQLKGEQALQDLGRVSVNSLVGLGGLFDVATPLDLPKHNEDFGQTLGYWGLGPGPYFVIPFLGPSSVRDASGTLASWNFDPLAEMVDDYGTYYGLKAVEIVDLRASLLQGSRMLDSAALDPYAFMRGAYLQRRRNLVYDGNPPPVSGPADAIDPFGDPGAIDPFADPSAPLDPGAIDPFADPSAPLDARDIDPFADPGTAPPPPGR